MTTDPLPTQNEQIQGRCAYCDRVMDAVRCPFCDGYSLGYGEGWRTAREFDGEPAPWEQMLDRAAEEMASWSGSVPSGADGFRPYAEKVLRVALGMRHA